MSTRRSPISEAASGWTFLTNHAHVLVCLARDPSSRMRDIAELVGVTERAVQRIITELEESGYITRERDGRRNHYAVRGNEPLRHPLEHHQTVASLLALVEKGARPRRRVG